MSPLTQELGAWLTTLDCGRVVVDTRLAHGDWRSPATAAQVEAVIARADVAVTTRLHGLALALKNGIPALAIDPVAGGAKVAAQAAAWGWPVPLPGPGPPCSIAASWTGYVGLVPVRGEPGPGLAPRSARGIRQPLTADLLSVLADASLSPGHG